MRTARSARASRAARRCPSRSSSRRWKRSSSPTDVEREIDELYGVPLEDFTRARNDLARRLKGAGEQDAAEEVGGLAKPSIAVWAINQLARRDSAAVRRLIEAGTRMREGQREALAGGSPEGLERAAADQRDAVAVLAREAAKALEAAGRKATPSTIDRVAATVRAAAVDEQQAGRLERGSLREEVELTGFGALAGMPVSPRREPPSPAQRRREEPEPRKSSRVDAGERRRRVAEAREALQQAREAERTARREAKQARAAAERAERDADAAEQEAEEAADAVRAAEEALERARQAR